MKKEILALCVALIALNGCQTDCQDCGAQADGMLSSQSLALFGETGGEPWGSSASASFYADTPGANQFFGQALGIADITDNGKMNIVTAHGTNGFMNTHGRVVIYEPSSGGKIQVDFTRNDTTITDSYGWALAAGDFCPGFEKDVVIASAPTYNGIKGGFGIIYKDGKRYLTKVRMLQPKTDAAYPHAGTQLAVGDVNGDGKSDLVFQSMPMKEDYDYLAPKVSVLLDVCGQVSGKEYTVTASVDGSSVDSAFGSALYVVDLDGNGQTEIVVVDNLYSEADNDVAANGAIYFYKFVDGALVKSRETIIGEHSTNYGASIESVAFSDIDGDGDLDLIVGEPMVQQNGKREGRVRTYTNNGASNSFDASDVKWSAVGGSSNMRFGSSVAVADVNFDGVNDLIVGAPGYREDGTARAQGRVMVFMGTKDGSVFSKQPFWTYVSNVSTSMNDDFGRRLAVANLDSKGWLDLAVGAPGSGSSTSSLDEGRVDVFMQSAGHCYTANGCFVQDDAKCYLASEASTDNKCLVCDPLENNFALVALQCEGAEDKCHEAAACDPAVGCQITNKPDGTSCGPDTCSYNAYATYACQSGECVETKTECGNYLCYTPNENGCPTSCQNNSDCTNGTLCIDSACVDKPNGAPEVTLNDSYTVVQGEKLEIVATASDPENEKLTYEWISDKTFLKDFTSENGLGTYSAPVDATAGSSHQLTLKVTDSAGNITQVTTTVTIVAAEVVIATPVDGLSTTNMNIVFSGTTNTTGKIKVIYAETGVDICSSEIVDSSWQCQSNFTPGTYTVKAIQTKDKAIASENHTFTVTKSEEDNMPPVIVLPSAGIESYPGDTFVIDASKSYDPDKDEISFHWVCTGELALDNDTGALLGVSVPDDYPVGSSELCTLTVKDSKGAAVNATIVININDVVENEIPVIVVDSKYMVHIGETITIDASQSYDPEGTQLTYKWASQDIVLTDYTSSITSFTVPKSIAPKFEVYLEVADADGNKNSISLKYDVVAQGDYAISITTPVNNAAVVNPVEFSGTASAENIVIVHDLNTEIEICRTVSDTNGNWSCQATLNPNSYRVQAYIVDENNEPLAFSDQIQIEVAASPEDEVVIPEIVLPVTGEIISLRPSISGNIKANDGKVHVWQTVTSNSATLLCSAIVKEDGSWVCTAAYDLNAATTYTLQANWEDTTGNFSNMSNTVVVTTHPNEDANIVILSPGEGAKLPSNYAVIIGGSGPVGSAVDVYNKTDSNRDEHLCSAFVSDDGYWACIDMYLEPGEYSIYADDAAVEAIVPSNIVNFSIVQDEPEQTILYEDTRGGSCSMTTRSTSQFGWFAFVAAFAGFAWIRRRRHA